MENADGLSVIIPTRGRTALLSSLLESIVIDARNCPFAIEIILADTSEPGDKQSVAELAHRFGACLLTAPAHVGEARNVGVRRAQLRFVLFLDSDVTIAPGTLAAHYNTLMAGADACLGLVQFTGRRTFAWRVVRETQLMLPFRYPEIASIVPWGPAANISFRRTSLDSIGAFDPHISAAGGEDVDLGFRFTAAGFRIITSMDAVVQHNTETWASWAQNAPRLVRYGRADFHLIQRHPHRTFIDLPSQLISCAVQILIAAVVLGVYGLGTWPTVVCALVAAAVAHALMYAAVKSKPGSSFSRAFEPLVIALLDLGKFLEAAKHGQPAAVLRRVKYLDDIASKDWHEIAATAWGVYASTLAFFVTLFFTLARSR